MACHYSTTLGNKKAQGGNYYSVLAVGCITPWESTHQCGYTAHCCVGGWAAVRGIAGCLKVDLSLQYIS